MSSRRKHSSRPTATADPSKGVERVSCADPSPSTERSRAHLVHGRLLVRMKRSGRRNAPRVRHSILSRVG
jgi:hypothetical protein